ncbi:MAG: hypothetical protein JW862_00555 [Anaerolineales bacterium]|nr:hypothetical protein [Anaerolineales bacterium]
MPDQPARILRTPDDLQPADIQALYAQFDAPILALDCGQQCAPHNPNGIPFCCDICHSVPAAYHSEWRYLEPNTDLWHLWRDDECAAVTDPQAERQALEADTPDSMLLLACLGPQACQREYRALSCRQFPFFPYITADYRFLGLAYEWAFEGQCWVISHLEQVTPRYRQQFVQTYDRLFAWFDDEFENYAYHSERLREHFQTRRRRIPLLHRNGNAYLLSPGSERLYKVAAQDFQRFGPYQQAG